VRRAATLVAVAAAVVAATATASATPRLASAPPRLTSAVSSSQRRASPATSYYLSLGDSLAQGVQPDPAGASLPTQQGYPDQLYAALRLGQPGLRLVKLGCSGETTRTMIHGGICSYPAGSQLAEAAGFLRTHRAQVSLITIDIGANDPDSCISRPTIGAVVTCVTKSFPETVTNLTKIMSTIRTAAGPAVRIIGMNYYVPELAEWRNGLTGRDLALVSERLVVGYNRLLTAVYQHYGARVADVFDAFHSGDFGDLVRVPGLGTLPRNVAAVCLWTWECASVPRGPNEHARAVGYGVIALAFLLADTG
jgi:lysophospholipase L1-like esterase